jgi:SpoIID/LytB domain protein
VEIERPSLASHAVRPPNSQRSRVRRLARLAIALGAAAVLAGFVFAPAASAATGDFVITGRGYGQGQGMSQWGMWQGARLGNTYQQILAFYYPGTTLTNVASVAPSRATVTIRITTTVDTFASVELTAGVTSATLFDSAGTEISSLAAGGSITLVYSGGTVQVSGSTATYTYVDLKPDSASGRVTVKPSEGLWSAGARSYWGYIRVLADSATGDVYVHNILPIDKFVAGVSEISPDWAMPTSTAYYSPDAVKALDVAARTYTAAHSGAVPYDDSRDMTYVGYNLEASYPYLTQAAEETAGQVLTYGGKLIATHFSSSSGGYTTNSAWSDTGQVAYEPAQPDPWSLTAPPTLPGYAWSVTVSASTLAADLGSTYSVGTITQVDVIERDAVDPGAHARYLRLTGSTGTKTIAARTFKSLVGLKSTLILSIVKDGSLNRYQQNDTNLVYTGTWTATSATAASAGSFRYTDAAGSCSVSFNGAYLAWLAKKSSVYGIAKLTLDGVDQGTVDLYSASATYGKVWETGTLSDGAHTLKIEWTGTKNSLATDYNISVDAFDISGNIVPAPKLNLYQQNDTHLLYSGTWTAQSASAASGGSFRYTDATGSCTVSFNGTYIAWLAKVKNTYGKAKVTIDGVEVATVDLYNATEVYKTVWETGLPAGDHTLTISWTGTKNSSATDYNIGVDGFRILGTIIQAPGGVRLEQDALTYEGTWATFTTSGASGGAYARANTSGAAVTIGFNGTYLAWIATKGTTLGKALVSLDGGMAQSVNLAATAVAYKQNVWNTGMLTPGSHSVRIWWDPSNTAGKYISVDAIDLVGSLQ